jgi:hypothetical protein
MRLSSSKIKKYNKMAVKKPVMVRVGHTWYGWAEGDRNSVFLTTEKGKDIEFRYSQIDDIQENVMRITKKQLKEMIREGLIEEAYNKGTLKRELNDVKKEIEKSLTRAEFSIEPKETYSQVASLAESLKVTLNNLKKQV